MSGRKGWSQLLAIRKPKFLQDDGINPRPVRSWAAKARLVYYRCVENMVADNAAHLQGWLERGRRGQCEDVPHTMQFGAEARGFQN